jgi:hypothetical protein
MSTPYQTGATDPRLLSSSALAKAKDVEARLNTLIGGLNAVPPSIVYTSTQTIVSQNVNGTYTWTCPAGVTSAKIECYGAGAGGGGGSSGRGGEGGGGGEYAAEPNYPLQPGQVYTYVVGNGGNGGTTGYAGQGGTDTIFDTGGIGLPNGVFANGGSPGSAFVGGPGGGNGQGNAIAPAPGNQPSPNSWESPGGSGGGNGHQSTGGCGGGAVPNSQGGATAGATSGGSGGAAGGGGFASNGGAGGNAAANGYPGGNPGSGGGGCGAATAAASGQNQYRLSSSMAYYGSDASGGNANQQRGAGTMYQGGTSASGGSYNGTMKSLGFLAGNPQSDLSGKTIDQVTIRLEWQHCWYNNGAYVVLGYTPYTYAGASWGAGGITAVKTWWMGPATDQGGGPVTTDLTGTGLGAALANGNAKSISLGPGTPGFNLYNYAYAYGAGGDNNQNPLITVNWHTGSQPVTAGAGADGKVVITYNVTGVLAAALQPAAGTDSSGNAFGQGYTGPVQATHPGSTPTTVEGWQSLTPLPSGLTGQVRYKMVAEANCILLDVVVSWSVTNATLTLPSFPSGYQPSIPGGLSRIYNLMGNSGTTAVGQFVRLFIGGGGGVQIIIPNTAGTGTGAWTGIIPLN